MTALRFQTGLKKREETEKGTQISALRFQRGKNGDGNGDPIDSPETAVRRGRGAIGKGIKRNDSPEIADRKKRKGDSNDSPEIADRTERERSRRKGDSNDSPENPDRTERERSRRKGDQMTAVRFQKGEGEEP